MKQEPVQANRQSGNTSVFLGSPEGTCPKETGCVSY